LEILPERLRMNFSKYQIRIFNEIENTANNVVVNAVAGSGKTTTIKEAVTRLPDDLDKAFIAFNNSIVDELKLTIKSRNTTITTMHSFCWRALLRAKPGKKELKKGKSAQIIQKLCIKAKIDKKKYGYYMFVVSKMVDVMRHNLMTEKEDLAELAMRYDLELTPDMEDMAIETLRLMDKNNRVFDFTDMIYRAHIDNIRLPKFDILFIDEAQDLSVLQQKIVSRILKRNGRMIAVGDPRQAIYGFAGADANSYNNLKNVFPNTVELPLSVNYRCGKNIVAYAKKLNPQIEAYDGNEDGEVRNGFCKEIRSEDWVLCRNLKPLIILNLYLITKGVKSYVKGVEIGQKLENYIKKLGASGVATLGAAVEQDIAKEISKLKKKGVRNPFKTEKIDRMIQQRDIIKVLSRNCLDTKSVITRIRDVFRAQENAVVLSTIHKSKGLENGTIFLLCPELLPSKYATQEWQLEQEQNLFYVAITRAEDRFIIVEDYDKVEKIILKSIEDEN